MMNSTLEPPRLHSELAVVLDLEKERQRACSWKQGHAPARYELFCVACVQPAGYACSKHKKFCDDIQNNLGVDGKLKCRKCGAKNSIEFVPLPS